MHQSSARKLGFTTHQSSTDIIPWIKVFNISESRRSDRSWFFYFPDPIMNRDLYSRLQLSSHLLTKKAILPQFWCSYWHKPWHSMWGCNSRILRIFRALRDSNTQSSAQCIQAASNISYRLINARSLQDITQQYMSPSRSLQLAAVFNIHYTMRSSTP